MAIKTRLDKIERRAGRRRAALTLPDGTELRIEPGELLDALLRCIDGEEHRLLPHLREMDPEQELASLIQALEAPLEKEASDEE